ncbi:MAG: septal ring lytic transglycosylase RlpA family protein, partial [Mariprofundaceae bacterium]|nr:septal ring lytic transglycosylase RlpA family protein [Mariprofundaceae bacterium]
MRHHSLFPGLLLLLSTAFMLSACSGNQVGRYYHPSGGYHNKAKLPSGTGGHRKTGKPYRIAGTTYYPLESSRGYDKTGVASWYGRDFHGKLTANGEQYDMHAMSAAHKTLPLPTLVRVTNLENGRSIVVRVNDRGPFVKSRLIDLSYAGAKALAYDKQGTTRVRVQTLDGSRPPL